MSPSYRQKISINNVGTALDTDTKSSYLHYPVLIGVYATAITFFFAMYQTIKFLSYINKDNAVSKQSLYALKSVRYCGITISVLYVIAMPLLFLMADGDDALGIILFALLVILSTSVRAVFAKVFEKRCNSDKVS
jgi:hypothetical protein